MPHTIARPAMGGPNPLGKPKPGPKGRVLEPYAREVLLMVREGRSMQSIANWLAEPPRNVAITRQAVHLWMKARIKKLVKLNAAFVNTGIGGPFQESSVVRPSQPPPERAGGLDPSRPVSTRPTPASRHPVAQPSAKRVDVSEFMVDESDLNRAQNPLISKA